MDNRRIDTELFPSQIILAFETLENAGFEAYAVGGCVRDIIMGRTPGDYDLTTNALPEQTAALFSQYRILTYGMKHGTVTVIIDGMAVEITTYRLDGEYTDNRHPAAVSFAADLKEDLSRRDFTINALACGRNGEIVDLFGGVVDIDCGIIRAVGDAGKRFEEDALRIMRALRFASKLGFEIEKETAGAAVRHCYLLEEISAERIRSELEGFVCGDYVGQAMISYPEIICAVIPEFRPCIGFRQNNPNHIYDVYRHIAVATEKCVNLPVLRFAAFFHDIGKPLCYTTDARGIGHFKGHGEFSEKICRDITRRLRFDNKTRLRLLTLISEHDNYVKIDRKAVKRRLIQLGEECFRQLLELQRADNMAKAPKAYADDGAYLDAVSAYIDEFTRGDTCLSISDLNVDGSDILKLGYSDKTVGDILSCLFDAVVDEKVENERYALLKYAESL